MNIRLHNIGRTIRRKTILNQINLNIASGSFVAILGPSGCGKTTLLRLIAGFDRPSTGTIAMDEHIVSDPERLIPPEKRNIGMVFQSFALWPHMNVREHVRFPILHHAFSPLRDKKAITQRIDEVLEAVGLSTYARRMPHELSGGQKQRVAIARAIAAKPSLLLMDEPLSSLDVDLRHELRKEIQLIHRVTQSGIVYVTHDQEEAMAMADQIIVMRDGAVEQIGSPRQIYHFPETEFVAAFVGKSNLIKGEWRGQRFYPQAGGDAESWQADSIAPAFRQSGVFPVKPDRLSIQKNSLGIPARVRNIQYQGREYHYTVQAGGEEWNIYQSGDSAFEIGDKVFIQYLGIHADESGKHRLSFEYFPGKRIR